MNQPLVSIIIPTYARGKYICRAIESAINQTYTNVEVIVVDDNGENTSNQLQTYQLLKPYIDTGKIKYLVHKINKNGSAARNTGIKNAMGEYISFLDDDDEFFLDKISKQVQILNSLNVEWAGVYCNSMDVIVNKNSTKKILNKAIISDNLIEVFLSCKANFGSSSLLLRRSVCQEINGFDETFKRHQDWEFIVRILRKYKLKVVEPDKALLNYYIYPDNINRPFGLKIMTYREDFLSKFSQDIESSPNKNKIYYDNYWGVALALLSASEYLESFRYLQKACRYNFPTIKDILRIFLYLYRGFKL